MTASGFARVVPVIFAIVAAQFTYAQSFPTHPMRFVVTGTGGSSDFAARLVAQGISSGLGQQVVVDSRGGALPSIEIVARAPADGYTLLYFGSALWLLPLMQKVSYDALRDFIPVSMVVSAPVILTVHPTLPVTSVKELIALAKAKPGVLNYGRASAGSSSNLSTELFKSLAGVNMVGIPYKSSGPALTGLLGGELQVLMVSAGGLSPHINSGRVRALAVGSAKRSASFPNLPTMVEAGVPGYEYGQLSGVFAPARTPAAIVDRLSREIVSVVNRADFKEKLVNSGTDAEGTTPQEAIAKIKSEIARLGKVIKEANIRGE